MTPLELLNAGKITMRNVLDLPRFRNYSKCKQNAQRALCSIRGWVRKCLVCKEDFKPARSDSAAVTCCKSCAAAYRYRRGKTATLYRRRKQSFLLNGYYLP